MWSVKFFLCCVMLELSLGQEEALLDIPQGTLKGLKTNTVLHGMPMYSFKGIPYAKPNIGPNKFRAPEMAEGWTGVRDATKSGSACMHFCMMQGGLIGDEDCLSLNVYTPDLNKTARRAVMVFIHPGGYNGGSGEDYLFGADYLVENDVIVVTLNHRLGVVGFLNTGDANSPGNAGLKDQTMALMWVQGNIGNFGGCKDRVTIFGHSSGAGSVQFHMLSPMSQGLFSGAIMMSGAATATWSISYSPLEDAMKLAKMLGLNPTSNAELVEQLAQVSTKDLVTTSAELSKTLNVFSGVLNAFGPSVEADVGQQIFLPADPWVMVKSGKIADVPLMVGITPEESALFIPMFMSMADMVNDHFDMLIPSNLNVTDPAERKMIGDTLKEFYFHGKSINPDTFMEFTHVISDIQFSSSVVLSTKVMNLRTTSPVYEYLFTFNSPFGFMKTLMQLEKSAVAHGDDITQIFYSNFHKKLPAPGSLEEQKINEMVEMWTNFAKDRNPSVTMNSAKVEWQPMGTEDNYLEIGDELVMKKDLLKDRVNLWAGIYKNVLGDYYDKLF